MPPVEVQIGVRPENRPTVPPVRSRASWHVRANAVVLAWLALTIAAALAQGELPAPRWLVVHVFLLGAISTAILIWSEHFATVLLRARTPDPRGSVARLGALNAGTVAVLYGVAVGPWPVAAAGAALAVGAVTWHAAVLVGIVRRALPGRFGHVVGWYVAAAGALVAGGVLGGLLAAQPGGGALHERAQAAHAQLNLLGWVGLTVLGTLFTLWPTVLRTRISELTRRWSRAALWLSVAGLAVTVAGLLPGLRWVAVAGLVTYAVAVAVALAPPVETLRRRRPHTAASWTLAAGVVWFEVALVAEVVVVATRPVVRVAAGLEPLLPLILAGFAGQVLIGSLTHLLPAVLGGGPPRFKRNAALIERGWAYRLAATNLGVPLLALPVPVPLRLLGWALVLAPAAAFVALAVTALTRTVSAGTGPAGTGAAGTGAAGTGSAGTAAVGTGPAASGAGVGPPGGGRRSRVSPAHVGVVIGCLLTALAVVGAMSGGSGPARTRVAPGAEQTVEVTLRGMRVQPGVIEAEPGTVLTLKVVNADAQRHDLRLSTGERTPELAPGESAVLKLAPLAGAVDGWCTLAGHRAAGMTMRIVPTTAAAARPVQSSPPGGDHGHTQGARLDPAAPMPSGWKPFEAAVEPAPSGAEHHVEIRVKETDLDVAPGVRQRMWTFNGTLPGPVLRGRVGDLFVVTFVNDGAMGHGIDFHAGALAPDEPMRTIDPGERLTYRFRAAHAGAWLYHCSTMPMSQHIANGMYGAVIIDPPGLPPVDREYVLVQGELYLGTPDARAVAVNEGRPDGWMFNGAVAGYKHAPLTAKAGERARIWVVTAGPGTGTAFHVVGAPFDTVYKEGAYLLREGDPGGAQVLDLAPAQGGFAELVFPETGHYPFVDHHMRRAETGASGIFEVSAP
ncbi:multicopper oxidase domain-containing protein [Nonomuraea cavernae]|uniref:multicopper oxidase domain-containing protein n=1 Tax=Nonomuraea cavernae TaxID=2045107 RepID=UPI00340FB00C